MASQIGATSITGTVTSLADGSTSSTLFTIPTGKVYRLMAYIVTGGIASDARLTINDVKVGDDLIPNSSTVPRAYAYLPAGTTIKITNVNGSTVAGTWDYFMSFLIADEV